MTAEQPEKTEFDTVYLEELKWIKERRQHLRAKEKLPDSKEDMALDDQIPDKKPGENPKRSLHELQTQALQADLCGLAISGGGIRSATYSLGVLQGLAAMRLLPRFDYLSTVSGGGYIGSWFSTWISRDGFDQVENKLLPPRLQRTSTPEVEAKPIRHLRLYSNYLAPRPGLFSFDGWVLIAIYLRNLLLNQLVLLLKVLGLFVGVRTIIEEFSLVRGSKSDEVSIICFIAALVMLVIALLGAATFAHGGCLRRDKKREFWLFEFWMACVVPWLLAAFFASLFFVAPSAMEWAAKEPLWVNLTKTAAAFGVLHGLLGVLAFSCRRCGLFSGIAMGAIGGALFFFVWRSLLMLAVSRGVTVATVVTLGIPLSLAVFVLINFLMVGLCGPRLTEIEREWWSSVNSRLVMLATAWAALFGTAVFGPWFLGQIWLMVISPEDGGWLKLATGTAGAGWLSALFAGLRAARGPDTKSTTRGGIKESLARLAPVLFLITLFLGLATATTWLTYYVYASLHSQSGWKFGERLPFLLTDLNSPKHWIPGGGEFPVYWALFLASCVLIWLSHRLGETIGVNTFSLQNLYANRLVRCYLGASKRKRHPEPVVNMDPDDDYEMSLLFPGLNFEQQQLVEQGQNAQRLKQSLAAEQLRVTQTPAELEAQRLTVQKLRAELLRAEHLSNEAAIQRFTTKQKRSALNKRKGLNHGEDWGPLHIINGALNQKASAVRSKNDQSPGPPETAQIAAAVATNVEVKRDPGSAPGTTAEECQAEHLQFLERQAESFVFTPLYSGSEATGYCPSYEFAGDVKVGTAVAVSGAAVSPNMGYHSSPAVTALLTVFNVRLGAWFGNPRRETRNVENPGSGGGLLFKELAGMTDATSDYIYLSDGGHFENMGVYELIRRRCRFIVAVDAGEDPKFHENVGRVVRQVRIDFGIWIEVDMAPVTPGPNGLCASHVVVGRIHYGDVHRPKQKPPNQEDDLPEQDPRNPDYSREQNHGLIIWIKNALTGDEPGDLINHAAMHPSFPYDMTLDQFFSEPQFESYRALGLHSVLMSLILPGDNLSQPASARCTGSAPIALPTRDACKRVRTCTTTDIFKHIYDFWLTKPTQYVTGYVQENEAYAKIQTALRQDKNLSWLAKELYGTKKERAGEPTNAKRISCEMAERLMANEMFTLLENVFLMLDLERQSLHPVHNGWMGVFHNWTGAPSLRKFWADQEEGYIKGLCHEYSPAFRRFVDQLMSGPDRGAMTSE